MNGGGSDPAQQAEECTMARGAFPEHPQQEGGEQRRVHESEHQLQDIHNIIERGSEVRGAH